MKKYKNVTVNKEVETIEEYICDRCEKVSKDSVSPYVQTIHIDWGYGSKFDTELWEIDLCED